MDRAIDTTAAEQGFVRGIHDGFDIQPCDVPYIEVDMVVRRIRLKDQVNFVSLRPLPAWHASCLFLVPAVNPFFPYTLRLIAFCSSLSKLFSFASAIVPPLQSVKKAQ